MCRRRTELTMNIETLYALGLALIFFGVPIILAAILLLFHSRTEEREVNGGGAIIIGPIPIIFGTDNESVKTVLLLSIVLSIVLIAAAVILHLMSR